MSKYAIVALMVAVIGGCSTSGNKYPYKGSRCLTPTTCPKACTADNECALANNEICCDFDGVKACAVNTACPRFLQR